MFIISRLTFLIFSLVENVLAIDLLNMNTFGGINMHCRDNENYPVDWWFLYKPGADDGSFMHDGSNFSYITSNKKDRWHASKVHIQNSYVLLDTMAPVYRETYSNHMAMISYNSAPIRASGKVTPSPTGILMTGILSGLWIAHSMNGYPKDITVRRKSLPREEIKFGHLFICLSINVTTLNNLGVLLEKIGAMYNFLVIPPRFVSMVPNWRKRQLPKIRPRGVFNETIETRFGQEIKVYYRTPNTETCLYKTFAKEQQVILDIYGSSHKQIPNFCSSSYGLRTIDKISLKLRDENPLYINPRTDKMRFAVSTAASWQSRTKHRGTKYWTCMSNLDISDSSGEAGLLICINNYDIWINFTNLKISEPECPNKKKRKNNKLNQSVRGEKKKTNFKKDV